MATIAKGMDLKILLNCSWAMIFMNYFHKGALLGQKVELNLWFVDIRPNSQKLFPSIGRFVIFSL